MPAPVHRRPEHDGLRARHRGRPRHADHGGRHRPPARPRGAPGRRRGQRHRGRRSASASRRHDGRRGASRRAGSAAPRPARRHRRGRRRHGAAARPDRSRSGLRAGAASGPRPSSWRSCLAIAGAIGLRESHFIGADTDTGRVAIYQGVPVDLPFGVHLYHVIYESRSATRRSPPSQRQTLFDHTLRSRLGRARRPAPVRGGEPVRSARLRELLNLGWVGVLTAIGFASVYTARQNQISSTSLIYAGGLPRRCSPSPTSACARACRTPTRGSCRWRRSSARSA